jgi:hypothetical protein
MRRCSAFASGRSTIASTTRSQALRSAGSVVTRTRLGSPPSTLAAAACAPSSARQAEASLRASTRTSPSAEAHPAMPHAMTPLPAIAGRS